MASPREAANDEMMAQLGAINQNLKSPPAEIDPVHGAMTEHDVNDAFIDNIRAKLD